MAEQRVTDDVLEHWASEAKKEPPGKLGSINLPAVVEMLIAEVRASRAREVEMASEIETWQGRCSSDQDHMTTFRRRAVAAEAERDVLQQRIDKALAWCEKANPLPHLNGDQFADLRAALTGEPDHA